MRIIKPVIRQFGLLFTLSLLASCSLLSVGVPGGPPDRPINHWSVELLSITTLDPPGEAAIPFGGISGVDYREETDSFFAISDDRSEKGRARFYEFSLNSSGGLSGLTTQVLKDLHGDTFEPGGVDAEAIRYHPDGTIFWSSETGKDGPGVYITTLDTDSTEQFLLPDYLQGNKDKTRGARNNKFIEGISFTPDLTRVAFAIEAPLYQDGPLPTHQSGAFSRILIYDMASRYLVFEYLYKLDPIMSEPTSEPYLSDNGVAEILFIDNTQLLVLERSGWHVGDMDFAFDSRLYLVDLGHKVDEQSDIRAVNKTLIASLGKLLNDKQESYQEYRQENYEAMSFGRRQKDGRLLYIFSDDNFHAKHSTQMLKLLLND